MGITPATTGSTSAAIFADRLSCRCLGHLVSSLPSCPRRWLPPVLEIHQPTPQAVEPVPCGERWLSLQALFWLSIVLWLVSLFSYALILSGHPRHRRQLYRTLILAAVAAMVTGGLYMLVGM